MGRGKSLPEEERVIEEQSRGVRRCWVCPGLGLNPVWVREIEALYRLEGLRADGS